MIRIEHLKKEYPDVTPLKDVNAVINDGDVIAVIGPSGTGKSTLLRCLNMLEKPTAGRIWIDDVEVTDPKTDLKKVRQKMGMVFQSFNLFGHMTVIENIMTPPMDLLGRSKQEAYDRGIDLLRKVGLETRALRYPDELSGGQKQRVAIARVLAMDPDIILLDEPTSALDPTMVGEVQTVVRDLAKTGKTMLIVTHEMAFAKAISSRVFYMDEGGIYEDGAPQQIFDDPLGENTRRFIRKLKVWEMDIENRYFDFPAAVTQIAQFCSKNGISTRASRHIQLAFEEMVQDQLLPHLKNPQIHVETEYSDIDESIAMTLRYNGEPYDVTAEGDKLSLAVLRSAVSEMTWTAEEKDPYRNRIDLKLKS